jgi:acetyl esterase/lipase
MKKIFTLIGILLIVGGLAYHYAALQIFNALVPKDENSILVQSDVPYGNAPRQTLDIYRPRTVSDPLPIVVFVHGGSWQEGNKAPYGFAGRALAAQGFLTLVINYRLHPDNRYPAFVEDAALALRWAAANGPTFGGDPAKLFAIGHSAGAYNVAQAVLDEIYAKDRPKLAGVITLAGPFDFVPLDSVITKKVFANIEDLPLTQPIHHASAKAPPFLILHGSADTTVFPRNAVALDKALRAAGASSELKIYPNLSHVGIMLALAKPLRKTPVLEDIAKFIKDKS